MLSPEEIAKYKAVEVKEPYKFIFGGDAEFSIVNLTSGNKYSYKVVKKKKSDNAVNDMYFCYLNGRGENKDRYMGYLLVNSKGYYVYNKGFRGTSESNSPEVKGILYALNHGNNPLPMPMCMIHHGKCARCGRRLKDPESVKLGFGKDCYSKMMVGM